MHKVKTTLSTFHTLSGLQFNPSKSDIFFAGVNEDLKAEIMSCIGFNEGAFSIRYLGIPLVARKLRMTDCASLIEKVTANIAHWSTK